MRRSSPTATTFVVMVAVLALGGCGGDDDADDGAGDGPTESAVNVAEPPIATDAGDSPGTVADIPTADTSGGEDPTSATATATPTDAGCGLTDEQVSSVMGIDMVPLDGPCGWEAPGLEAAVVEVYLSGGDVTMLAGAEGEEVAGVGDEARFDFLDVLNFRVDDRFYYVQVLNMGGAAEISTHDASVALAQLWVEALT